jgi:micrococcal nuclease
MSKLEKWLILAVGAVLISLIIGNIIEVQIKKVKIPEIKYAVATVTPIVRQKVKVVRVIDGDTIEIEGGEKVRYIGMDTPETVDPKKPIQCFGKEASNKNKELVEGKEVELEKDVSNTDKYGRLLRYIWLDNEMINEKLVKMGYARLETVPPDVRYSELLINDDKEARINNRGLWSQCQ